MPVKHWSFAGLLLTYWCNARCADCYVCSSPEAGGDMSVADALAFWEQLQSASPHGCRIHIGGGEPFGRWETLIQLARRAAAAGLGPLEAVETNVFWAVDERIVRERLAALDAAGMGRLTISADPYHQQYVPIARARLAARVAEEVLGTGRVRVRWRDWLAEGFDTGALDANERAKVFGGYLARGRDRLTGRAAAELAGLTQLKPARAFVDSPCREPLLRSRHVHVDGAGIVCPGTCAGIVLGRAGRAESVGEIWSRLWRRFADADSAGGGETAEGGVLSALVSGGPTALLEMARAAGYDARPEGYAGQCHLCWDVRRWLFGQGLFPGELAPAGVYEP